MVSNTAYNRKIPLLIGTNIINRCRDAKGSSSSPPEHWQMAFDSQVDDNIPVKTTNNYGIRLAPGEIKALHSIARKLGQLNTAITEHVDTSLSDDLTVCPCVVQLKDTGATTRIPLRVCNLSACIIEIRPKSHLCSLNGVKVVDSWTPDSSQEQETKPKSTSFEDLGVKINTLKISLMIRKSRQRLF